MKWNKVLEKFVKSIIGVAVVAAIGAALQFVNVNAIDLIAQLGLGDTIWSAVTLGLLASVNNWYKHRNDVQSE